VTRLPTADEVVEALSRHPDLFLAVRLKVLARHIGGPWMNTGNRFGDPGKKNVWGLRAAPKNRSEAKQRRENPNYTGGRWLATVRPAEEWGEEAGNEAPGKWFWNVDTGRNADRQHGIARSRMTAMDETTSWLRQQGWVVDDHMHPPTDCEICKKE